MNTLIATSLFDNPWVVVVIVLISAFSSWLMQRRQRMLAANRPDGDEPSPVPETQERPERPRDLQDVLRQLLGDESPPPPPPPIPRASRDEQTLPAIHITPPSQTQPALGRVAATRIEAHTRRAKAARPVALFHQQAKPPARAVRAGARAVRRWRDPRVARQAFIASLVFAPPKGLET